MPAANRMHPASAIIAPLSVQNSARGKYSSAPDVPHDVRQPFAQATIRADAAGDDQAPMAR